MRKKKIEKSRKEYAAEWSAMTPRQHFDQAAEVVGVVLAVGDTPAIRGANLAHAQTHLLAGLLKIQLSGEVSIPDG